MKVRRYSCLSFRLWCNSLVTQVYAEVFREVEPKRLKLHRAAETLQSKQRQLAEAMEKLRIVQETLAGLKNQFDESNDAKETLTKQVWHCRCE